MAYGRYDAIIIGGGHHGTIMACYLAKAGMSVAVLERHTAFGGGAISEEGPSPGFGRRCWANFRVGFIVIASIPSRVAIDAL